MGVVCCRTKTGMTSFQDDLQSLQSHHGSWLKSSSSKFFQSREAIFMMETLGTRLAVIVSFVDFIAVERQYLTCKVTRLCTQPLMIHFRVDFGPERVVYVNKRTERITHAPK